MPPGSDPAAARDRAVTLTAPAKLNLNLRITGRRADGYHLLDSVVVFTEFGDRLTIRRTRDPDLDGDRLNITGPFSRDMPALDADNICLRAVQAFRAADGVCGPLHIELDKQIPAGAGLGGGSSDAAVILRHLNDTSPQPLSAERLADVALSLGADVPVCLAGAAQRMTGIGENLDRLLPAPTGEVVLARPDIALSTADVFARLNLASPARPADSGADIDIGSDCGAETRTDAATLIAIGNDLRAAAEELAPSIADLLSALAACAGNRAAQMSGSGSACFGLFRDKASADAAAVRLRAAGYWAVATRF